LGPVRIPKKSGRGKKRNLSQLLPQNSSEEVEGKKKTFRNNSPAECYGPASKRREKGGDKGESGGELFRIDDASRGLKKKRRNLFTSSGGERKE